MEIRHKIALHVRPQFSVEDSFVLRHLVKKTIRKFSGKNSSDEIVIVEVGSFLGNGSTQVIIEAMKGHKAVLYCVDTWEGNQNVDWHVELAREYSLLDTFLYHVQKSGARNFVKPMIMESKDAALIFKDKSCNIVFIDADHSYEQVKNDNEMWLPKVKQGGILCGHDCEGSIFDVDHDVIESHLHSDFVPLERFKFEGCHPGVIKAVHILLGERATLWAHKSLKEFGLDGYSSIWHVNM